MFFLWRNKKKYHSYLELCSCREIRITERVSGYFILLLHENIFVGTHQKRNVKYMYDVCSHYD